VLEPVVTVSAAELNPESVIVVPDTAVTRPETDGRTTSIVVALICV